MSDDAIRRVLWLGLLVTLPVPYWVMEGGWVPALWLAELAGFTLAVLVTEGGSIVALLTGLFVAQAVGAAVLLHLVARILARALQRRVPENRRTVATVGLVLALLSLALLRVYQTPLVDGGQRISLLELFA